MGRRPTHNPFIRRAPDYFGLLRWTLIGQIVALPALAIILFLRAKTPSAVIGIPTVFGNYIEMAVLGICVILAKVASKRGALPSLLEATQVTKWLTRIMLSTAFVVVVAFAFWFLSARHYSCLEKRLSKQQSLVFALPIVFEIEGVTEAESPQCRYALMGIAMLHSAFGIPSAYELAGHVRSRIRGVRS